MLKKDKTRLVAFAVIFAVFATCLLGVALTLVCKGAILKYNKDNVDETKLETFVCEENGETVWLCSKCDKLNAINNEKCERCKQTRADLITPTELATRTTIEHVLFYATAAILGVVSIWAVYLLIQLVITATRIPILAESQQKEEKETEG